MTNNAKIAIIEDDVPIQELYAFKLKHEGLDVKVAGDGEAGLKLIQDFLPDLILLDLMMPIKSGEDVLVELRKSDWGKDTKVIILTNLSEAQAPTRLKDYNVARYVIKAHYTPQQVVDIVREVLAS